MLNSLVSNWHFPPVPVLFVFLGLWLWFYEHPRPWYQPVLAAVSVLSYPYANIFPMLFVQTPFSMALVVIATIVPGVSWSLVLIRKQKPEIGNRKFSDGQLLVRFIGGLVVASIGAYGAAFFPVHCSNAKCDFGVNLFGPLEFGAYWATSLWSGLIASFCLLGLYGVACRRLARDR